MNVTIYLVAAAVVPTVLVLCVVIWVHVQQQAAIDRLDDRIAHLMAGTSLLTDTTEGAMRDVAIEISRLAAMTDARPRSAGAGQRRIAGAAKKGLSVQDIAADEDISETEVRLQLQLERSRKERYASLR